MDWQTCGSCEEEFKVLTDSSDEKISYCPFCGEEIIPELEEDDEDGIDWSSEEFDKDF